MIRRREMLLVGGTTAFLACSNCDAAEPVLCGAQGLSEESQRRRSAKINEFVAEFNRNPSGSDILKKIRFAIFRPLTNIRLSIEETANLKTRSFSQVSVRTTGVRESESPVPINGPFGFFDNPRYLAFSFSESDDVVAVELF